MGHFVCAMHSRESRFMFTDNSHASDTAGDTLPCEGRSPYRNWLNR